MSVICSDIIRKIELLAPKHLAEAWDNVGLLIGSPDQVIHKVMVTLDVDLEVVDESIAAGANLIISHHPVIFNGITDIRTDSPQGSLLASLLKADIAVYAAHTNLDSAPDGVNDILARRFALKDVKPLTTVYQEPLHKLIVFVPDTHVEQVRSAMIEAGAGHIGNYSHCTFLTQGTGTFLPLSNTKPFIGEQGKVEYVAECRLETVVPARLCSGVIKAMLAAHPYEEVAYDEYLLLNKGAACGLGRVGSLAEQICMDEFISLVKSALNTSWLKVAAPANTLIQKVAVCGGSGAGLIKNAIQAGADILVTGDVKYHDAQQAVAAGMAIIDAGHFATEQPLVEYIVGYLNGCSADDSWDVPIIARKMAEDIFTTY